MKKRILSILLVALMVVSLMPVTAAAAGPNVGDPIIIGDINYKVTAIGNPNTLEVSDNTSYSESSLTIDELFGYSQIDYTVTSIGNSAFANCKGLTSVDLPRSVTNIGESAFNGCTNLRSVTCKATTPPSLGSDAFANCSNDLKIYVPKASVESYKTATNWSTYADKIEAFYTIADILPENFPTSQETGWSNRKGAIVYKTDKLFNIFNLVFTNEIPLSTILEKSNNQYTDGKYSFNMESDELVSISVAGSGIDAGTYLPYQPWSASEHSNNLPDTAGSYYLTEDVTLGASWNVPTGTTNLDLNGYVIKLADDATGSVIKVPANATLNLYDCGNDTHYFTVVDDGLWKLTDTATETTETVTGGVITGGNNTSSNGGGVFVEGTFNMYGGTVVGNKAENGGGVSDSTGTFTMSGGMITGNTATSGGGVYAAFNNDLKKGVNILVGGTITGNTAMYGGGVFVKEEECFAAGTPITMADGSRKPIETLKIGDVVRVFDHDTGTISTAKLFDLWKYPEKHSGAVTLHFSHGIDVTVVYGHSFFDREANKYVSVSRDNVKSYVGHEFYNVDDACWETLIGYDLLDGKVDTYVITSEKHLNCVANGMLTNEDGFYTTVTNIFEYGDGLKINATKKADDIEKYGLWDFENMKYISQETYDALNLKYMSVAFGKGLITPEAFAYLEAYWCGVDPELLCGTDEKTEKATGKSESFAMPKKMLLTASPAAIPTEPGVYVGGTLQIVENVGGNLYLSSGKAVTLGTGEDGSVAKPTGDFKVGVTTQTAPTEDVPVAITTNGASTDTGYFTSDNADYEIKFNTDHLELAVKTIPSHTHNPVKVNGQAATESAAGFKDYYECKDSDDACHEYFEDATGLIPIENLDAWKAKGGKGYIAPLPTHSSSGGGTPAVTVPVSGNENSVKVSASVSGSTATVKTMTDAELNKVTGGEAVEIDLTGLKKDIDTAKLPTEMVEKIADKDGMSVKLSTATVTFDKAATQEIASQADGSTIQLVVDDIKTVSLNAVQKEAVGKLDTALIIDAYLVSNGVRLCTEGKGGFGGGKASVALPYELKNNRTAANYSVYYVDDAGKLEKLAAKYDAELGAFVFDITHFSNYVVAYDENAMPFADVPAGKYYYDAVKWALENGITEGKKTTLFDPSGSVTRAQVVTFLWRAAGKPVVNYAMNMSDVASGKYYTEAVRWALAEGITKGTDAAHFSPNATCTRGQIVSFLYRYAKAAATKTSNPFTDVKAGAYYYDAVLWAVENGITGGKTAMTFVPKEPCTRAQVVTFLYRYMGK